MGIQTNPYPLRIEKSLMEKLKIVAASNGRSVNKEIEYLVRQMVAAYEQEHGAIPVQPDGLC